MTSDLAALVSRVPAWRDRADVRVTFLSGGITNQNYRVDVGAESFVLRRSGVGTALLGIDRFNEYAAARAAASIGVAPEVVYFIEPEGYLVTRFLDAREIPPAEMRQPATIRAVAAVLKRVHSLPPIPGAFSPFRIVRDYDALARRNNVTTFPDNYAWLCARMAEIESALARLAQPPAPCHNDLLNGNFLRDTADHIRILDWEYAGMGDPFFDLANLSAHHDFTDADIHTLLDAYGGEVTPRAFAHLKLQQIMSDFREAMWGVVQQGISQLDYNFRAYADRFFAKLTARLHDPHYPDHLANLT